MCVCNVCGKEQLSLAMDGTFSAFYRVRSRRAGTRQLMNEGGGICRQIVKVEYVVGYSRVSSVGKG